MIITNPHHYFYACNGAVLENLEQLLVFLNTCDDGTFYYHANEHKNDYANWIRDIIQHKTLANKLFRASTQKDMVRLVYDVVSKRKNKKAVLSQLKAAMVHG